MFNNSVLIVGNNRSFLKDIKKFLDQNGLKTTVHNHSDPGFEEKLVNANPVLVLIYLDDKNSDGFEYAHLLHKFALYPYAFYTDNYDADIFYHANRHYRHEDFIILHNGDHRDIHVRIVLIINRLRKRFFSGNYAFSKGITGLRTYLHQIKEKSPGQVAKVPVDFEEIVFFTTDVLPEGKSVKTNYLWFKTMDHRMFFLKTSLRRLSQFLPFYFQRISDHYIVNLSKPYFQGKINSRKLMILNRVFYVSHTYIHETSEKLDRLYPEFK